MNNMYNPFKDNRAEQMKELWKYYVPFTNISSSGKPVVLEGGRGSGKTMLFQCNSWRQVLSQLEKKGESASDLFESNGFIGIYYRVDTTFVWRMSGRKNVNWSAIFETYFAVSIMQEILDLMIELMKEIPIDKDELAMFIGKFSRKMGSKQIANSLYGFRDETENYLDCIEDIINGIIDNTSDIRLVNSNRLICDICKSFGKLFKRSVVFKIFIDEYETLQEYQQMIINTLIKHSTIPVIYNIGLRPEGMKSNKTISGTETIESPHDYESVSFTIDSKDYQNVIKEICKIRINLGKEQGEIPTDASDDITYYLGDYSLEDEMKLISSSSVKLPHLSKLSQIIRDKGESNGLSDKQIKLYIKTLCTDAPILNSRLHYALLCKDTTYTPSIIELYDAYTNKSSKYEDWMHNRKHGLVYLLCKETKREKMYYGFDVFAALSSNTIRYFLELCEQTFNIAFLNEYNWGGKIPADIQSEAAKYVSERKISDIVGYEPYGVELRIFTQYLGEIFYKLHTDSTNTLGEPEPNHFSTKDLSLSKELKQKIASAIMWNVLQVGEPTKRKQSILSPETVDYYLTKIYVPYFGISYRNQRKIQIDVNVLSDLLSGKEEQARNGLSTYFSKKAGNKHDQISLFDYDEGE